MDVRIGNDIKIVTKITNLSTYNIDDIHSIECFVRHTDECDHEPNLEFHCPSEYTIHGCGDHHYNVLPHQHKVLCCGSATPFVFHNDFWSITNHKFSHHHCVFSEIPRGGECGCEKKNKFRVLSKEDMDNGTVIAVFPSFKQLMCGSYNYKIMITLKEDGYGIAGLHTYTFDFGNIFNLCCRQDAAAGDIIINLEADGVKPKDGVTPPPAPPTNEYIVYSGTRSSVPTDITEEEILAGEHKYTSLPITITSNDDAKCKWWAVTADSGLQLTSCVDDFNTEIKDDVRSITVGQYKVYYMYTVVADSAEYKLKFNK